MNIEIEAKRKKTKLVGVRLFQEEYDFIGELANKKKVSRSFVAELLLRAALAEVSSVGEHPRTKSRSRHTRQ